MVLLPSVTERVEEAVAGAGMQEVEIESIDIAGAVAWVIEVRAGPPMCKL